MSNDASFVLTIMVDKNGSLSVTGPINDKILSLGLLEMAKNIVLNHKESSNLVVPKLVVPKGMSS
jgi:hypothetical protein